MTTDRRDDSTAFRAALIEDALERAGEHPELDTLVDYLSDTLDEDQDECVRDHLAACRECGTVVLDLDPLARPEATSDGVADLELEIAWKDLRSRLRDSEASSRASRFARWPAAVAATLLVGVVGLSVWVNQLQLTTDELRHQVAELSRPQVNPPIVYLDGISRSDPKGSVAELAPDQPFVLLIVIPSAPEAFSSFEALLTDSAGDTVWSGTGLELSGEGTLRLMLPRELVPAGNYRVQIHGVGSEQTGARQESLVDTALQVLYR